MMQQRFKRISYGLLGLVLSIATALCSVAVAEEDKAESAAQEKPKVTIPFDEIRVFADIFSRVKKDYVESVEDKELMESAIRGMLAGLDPHSTYLNKKEYKELHEGTTGEFGGLGIEIGLEDGFVKVIAPIDDTPAQKAGILAGDVIIRLDDKPVKGIGLNKAVEMMRGKPGEAIVLTIVRDGEAKPLKIKIVRAIIKVKSVKSRMLEPGYFYLRVTQFQSHTAELLRTAIESLRKQNKDVIKGVVLDLRNNPGGILSGAVSVTDIFLEDGLIVYTEGRSKDSATKFHARPGDMINGAPLVVIVNGGSASASEIVAGALQDHKRAIILGEKTFGKGSVQTILPMNNGDAIKLTTARYFTPSGRSIQAKGIEPDIELNSIKVTSNTDKEFLRVKESQLSGHLKNREDKEEKSAVAKKDKKRPLAETDYPLFESLNLLKSLVIISTRMEK